MAWRFKDATVLVVDVGRSMRQSMAEDEGRNVTRADMALRMARNLLQQRLLFSPKHEVGIVLLGTSVTRNELQADGYANVFVARGGKIDVPDLQAIAELSRVPQGAEDSDAVNGLVVSLDLMIKRTRNQKYNKTIWLLSDAASVSAGDPDLEACVKQLEVSDTKLCVTLFGVGDGGTPWCEVAGASKYVEIVSLSTMARQCSLCVKAVEQRAKVRMQLEISPDMVIPVGVFTKTTTVRYPALKKQSKLANSASHDLPRPDGVITERSFRLSDNPDADEINVEDRVKGYKYGQNIVPMSEYDEAALMYTTERTLKTLGFANDSAIGPEHSIHHIDVVAADRGDPFAHYAFESLVDAMTVERRVLIGRYSFRNNSRPRLVALFPEKGRAGETSVMVMQYLPFAEDIRGWTSSSLPEATFSQSGVVSRLIDCMRLDLRRDRSNTGVPACPRKEVTELLRPEDTHNPALARFYAFLIDRALCSDSKVLPPGPEAMVFKAPELAVGDFTDAFAAAFGLTLVERQQGTRKRFWQEAIVEKRREAVPTEVDTKRIKVDTCAREHEKTELKVKEEVNQGQSGGAGAAPACPAQVHIGSVHPERDFERWLGGRAGAAGDATPAAIEQLSGLVERLAEEGESFHAKALSCLACLRRGCAREAEAAAYNDLVRRLARGTDRSRVRAAFWQRLRDAALGLLTDAEVPTSTVSVDEAQAFLRGEEDARPSSRSLEDAAQLSDRDLEAMIE